MTYSSHVVNIVVSIVTMTTGTPATTSQSCAQCTLNSTCIQALPPIVSTSNSGALWAGGILVGMVSGILVMIIVWVVTTTHTIVVNKKSIIDRKNKIERFSMIIIIEICQLYF